MRGNGFKCPYCGSTHYEHTFPKDKTIPVFLRSCLRCGKYQVWIKKTAKGKSDDSKGRTDMERKN